eukprot:1518191-Pleurochrysis_carterae.AAC.2
MSQPPSPEPAGKPLVPAAPGQSGPKQPAPEVAHAAHDGGCQPASPLPHSPAAPTQPCTLSRMHHLNVDELAPRLPPPPPLVVKKLHGAVFVSKLQVSFLPKALR